MAALDVVAAAILCDGPAAMLACTHLRSDDGLEVQRLIVVAALVTACDRTLGFDQDPLAGVVTGAGNPTLADPFEPLLVSIKSLYVVLVPGGQKPMDGIQRQKEHRHTA